MPASWLTINGFNLDTPLGFVLLVLLVGGGAALLAFSNHVRHCTVVAQRWVRANIAHHLRRVDRFVAGHAEWALLSPTSAPPIGEAQDESEPAGAPTEMAAPTIRWAVFAAFFTVVTVVSLLSLPVVSLIVLLGAYYAIASIWRMCDHDERRRIRIVKELSRVGSVRSSRADDMPDMRVLAMTSALLLLVVLPLLHWRLNEDLGCFASHPAPPFHNWVMLSFDALFKSVIDWSKVYDAYLADIQPSGLLENGLVFLTRFTIAAIVVQGAYRAIQIRKAIHERVAVAVAIGRYQDLSRVGRRCVPALLSYSYSEGAPRGAGFFDVLGVLADVRAIPRLVEALYAETGGSLEAAEKALARIGLADDGETARELVKLLKTVERADVLEAVLKTLRRMRETQVIPELQQMLANDNRKGIRRLVIYILGETADASAMPSLVGAFAKDSDQELKECSAVAILAICRREDPATPVQCLVARIRSISMPVVIPILRRLVETVADRGAELAVRTEEKLEAAKALERLSSSDAEAGTDG